MLKVYIETYGCTLNQADSDIMKAVLKEKSYQIVDDEENSDVVVINTCTVKGATENKIFGRIRNLLEKKRRFVVAGCFIANSERLRKEAPLAPVVGTSSLGSIADAVEDSVKGLPTLYNAFESKDELPKSLTAPIMRVPINEGCVSSCYYCQTKLARPMLRSYSPKTIVKWIDKAVENGAREIQITSMDSGAYGLDIQTNLVELLDAIADDDSQWKTDKEFLIRLGMINPGHAKRMLPDIIRLLKGGRFYKFLHVPVQTGSEKVCREMNRDHTVKDFSDIVEALRSEIPDVTIATDVIVGYPTETETDFKDTLDLIRKTEPDITNVSKFSARTGTKAKEMKPLPTEKVKGRSRETSALVRAISSKRKKASIGKTYKILITENYPDFKGRDISYRQVVVRGFKGNLGDFADVEITDANHGSLFGEMKGGR